MSSEKVKLSKDGSSIDFVQSESLPTSLKKFRQSPEIEGFYRFIFENDLQKEAFDILERIIQGRKAKKAAEKAAIKEATKAAKVVEKVVAPKAKETEKAKTIIAVKAKPEVKIAPKAPAKAATPVKAAAKNAKAKPAPAQKAKAKEKPKAKKK